MSPDFRARTTIAAFYLVFAPAAFAAAASAAVEARAADAPAATVAPAAPAAGAQTELVPASATEPVVSAPARRSLDHDQTVRFVNGDSITRNDVRMRIGMLFQEFRRAGQALPQNDAEELALMAVLTRRALDQLTDEALFVEKARALKIEVDRDRIALDVLEDARAAGMNLTLADQALARRIRERARLIEYVISYFDSRVSQPDPGAARSDYQRRIAEFRRPARAQALILALTPDDPAVGDALRRGQADLLKRAQTAGHADLRASAERCLATYLDAAPAEQLRLLDVLAEELAARAGEAGLSAEDTALIATAVATRGKIAALRNADQVKAELEQVRAQVLALPRERRADAFREAVRRLSQGRNAQQGGDLGWIESGTAAKEVDAQLFSSTLNEPSPIFAMGSMWQVVLVLDRVEARTLSYDEAAGEIERAQYRDRRDAIRNSLARVLRSQATIRDLEPVR